MRKRLLLALADLAIRRNGLVIALSLVVAVVSGLGAWRFLGLDSNQDNLVSTELEYHARYMRFVKEFGDLEYLYVVIDMAEDPAAARAFAVALGNELEAKPDLFQVVHVKFEAADFGENLLLLAPEAEVEQLLGTLGSASHDVGRFATFGTFSEVFGYLAERMAALTADDASSQELTGGFLEALVGELEAGVSTDPAQVASHSRIDTAFPSFELPPGAAFQQHGNLLLVSVMPKKDYTLLDPVEVPLRELRLTVRDLQERHPGVEAGVTGRAALSADEVQRTSSDMVLGAVLAILGVSLVFMLFFRGVVRPLLAIGALLIGIAWSAGFATLAVGHLNFLSSIFTIILIGIGIDFGIHVLARYQGALFETKDSAEAIRRSVVEAGRGNLTAGLTTALAFYSTLLTDFEGLAQLGLIAGSGVVLCCLSMLVLLPALLYRLDRSRGGEVRFPDLPTFALLEGWARKPAWILPIALAVSLLGLPFLSGVKFDENLLELQAETEESVIWERRLEQQADVSSWITVSLVDSVEEAQRRHAAFERLEEVAKVESVGSFFGPEVDQRRERLTALGERIGPLACPGGTKEVEEPRLIAALERFEEALESVAEMAITQPDAEGVDALIALQERVAAVRAALPGKAVPVGARQSVFFDLLHARLRTLGKVLRPSGWTLDTIPAGIRRHLIGGTGQIAVYVSPKESVWKPEAMTRFLEAVRAVDPLVTGATVSVHESTKTMKTAFITAIAITLTLTCLLLLFEFRLLAPLAMIPLGVGALWMLELMGATGIGFNMANFFTVPVLIGIGIDDGVHMVNRYREDPRGSVVGHATGTGVILSSLTTMIGFGALATAKHPGLASIGEVMALGALALLLSAVIVLPAACGLLRPKEPTEEARPEAAPPSSEPLP